jgi:hypothetical protein
MTERKRQAGDIVGNYRLERKVKEDPVTRTWEAEQLSMHRPVMLEVLSARSAQDEELVREFLADVRAKALVSHPGVGSVYEAVTNDEATFFSRERLDGPNLAELAAEGRGFSPLEVVNSLGQISAAMIYLEEAGVATGEFARSHFVLVSEDQIRLMNLAIDGERDEATHTRTKALLGGFFDEMVQNGQPGSTRVKSLCGFMTDPDRPAPLSWRQIADLCQQVRDQLEDDNPAPAPGPVAPIARPRQPLKIPPSVWALIAGVILIGGLIFFMVLTTDRKDPPVLVESTRPPKQIEIPPGRYEAGDDKEVAIRNSFLISRAEVSVAEYRDFLKLPNHREYQHPDQPTSKTSHEPDDWDALWRAAVKGETWQGRAMSLGCPVVGIDWWDAHAFAKWRDGTLPTLSQWMAAASMGGPPSATSAWGKVGKDVEDITGAGVAGMAGNVREWTRRPEIDPAKPLAPKSFVVAGASFEEPAGGISARLWVVSRSVRRGDLGFRLVAKK